MSCRRSVLVLLVLSLGAGCGDERDPYRIAWDLSDGNEVARVFFEKPEIGANELEPISSVRIRLPADQVFAVEDGLVHDVTLARNGDRVAHIQVDSHPMEIEEAFRLAATWARQFALPPGPLREWYEKNTGKRAREGPLDDIRKTQTSERGLRIGGAAGPAPTVQIRHWSGDDDRPAIVSIRFFWELPGVPR